MKQPILLLLILITPLFFSCKQKVEKTESNEISGRLINLSGESIVDSSIIFTVGYPILDRKLIYTTKIKPDGSFHLDIPLVVRTLVILKSVYGSASFPVDPQKENYIEITKQEDGVVNYRLSHGAVISPDEEDIIGQISMDLIDVLQSGVNFKPFDENADPDLFRNNTVERMNKDLSLIDKYTALSPGLRNQIRNQVEFWYLTAGIFDYHEKFRLHTGSPSDRKLERSYYTFLGEFDWDNPSYLYPELYSDGMQLILKDTVLAIPDIDEYPVGEWIEMVKPLLADLTGVKSDQFYDLLAANSYVKQFHTHTQPLSSRQESNILSYYSNRAYTQLLVEESRKTEATKSVKSYPVSEIAPTVVLDSIISKYKGHVVFVDFWATWCGPCLDAMIQSKLLREAYHDKDIVFVYIAGFSSPETIWRRQVVEIAGGEHYYLNKEQWEYTTQIMGAKGIPFYLLYNTEGEIVNRSTGYPGNETVKRWIHEIL